MPTTPVHPSDTAELLADLRETARKLADVLRDQEGDGCDLDVERYVRLAEYALAHAHVHETTREETTKLMFAFQSAALGVLEPAADDNYKVALFQCDLAFDAIRAITELSEGP
ncbi:MAG TPA: hypothetical protein VFX13_13875, partial [Gaiellales bacterium]|nr:hypothetical protein [Gaiellales bacterium]